MFSIQYSVFSNGQRTLGLRETEAVPASGTSSGGDRHSPSPLRPVSTCFHLLRSGWAIATAEISQNTHRADTQASLPGPRTAGARALALSLATAGGVGCAPIAPGTFGSALAVLLYFPLAALGPLGYGLLTLALLAVGCGSRPGGQPQAHAVRLNGAGATFPYPLYSKWFWEYEKVVPQVRVEYQSIGSGGGIQQLKAPAEEFLFTFCQEIIPGGQPAVISRCLGKWPVYRGNILRNGALHRGSGKGILIILHGCGDDLFGMSCVVGSAYDNLGELVGLCLIGGEIVLEAGDQPLGEF